MPSSTQTKSITQIRGVKVPGDVDNIFQRFELSYLSRELSLLGYIQHVTCQKMARDGARTSKTRLYRGQ
jgi:hypothetical protein